MYELLTTFAVYVLFFSVLLFYEVVSGNPEWDGGVRKIVVYRLGAISYRVFAKHFNYKMARVIAMPRVLNLPGGNHTLLEDANRSGLDFRFVKTAA